VTLRSRNSWWVKPGDDGVDLVGPDGLLGQLTKQVLEAGLEVEMDEHLGYDKQTPSKVATARTVVTEPDPRQ